jgi:hypothetical protein
MFEFRALLPRGMAPCQKGIERMRILSLFRLAVLTLALTFLVGAAAHAGIVINVDKRTQEMSVLVDGREQYRWPISTATRGYSTPAGKYKPFRLEEDHYSREFDDAPMPHSIFFTTRGHAIHGTHDIKNLGRPASKGCVRLAPEHARTLFKLVEARGLNSTQVVVTGGAEPQVAEQRQRRRAAPPPDYGYGYYDDGPYGYYRGYRQPRRPAWGYSYGPAPRGRWYPY